MFRKGNHDRISAHMYVYSKKNVSLKNQSLGLQQSGTMNAIFNAKLILFSVLNVTPLQKLLKAVCRFK